MNNTFTTIPGFSMYEASTKNGIIRNVKTKHIMSPYWNTGYKFLVLKNDEGIYKHGSVHQFVALTYIDDYTLEEFYSKDKTLMVDHIDGTRHNNDLSNLRVLTNSENQKSYHNIKQTNPDLAKRNAHNGIWYTINDDHTYNFHRSWYMANAEDPGKEIYFQEYGVNVEPEIVK